MKQKRKLGRKLLSFVLALAMIISNFTGLVPGMSMTVKAADVTISPENSGTVSVAANGVYTAVPNPGFDFDHWEYDYGIASSSTDNPKDFSHYGLTGPVKAFFVKQRAKATVTANSFTYDGSSNYLVSVSDVVGGTVKYKAADDTWTETIPSGTAAGSYTITYKIFSTDDEYDDSQEKSVTATIAKATASATVTANALTYNGSAQELVSVSDLVGGTVNYLVEEKDSAVYTSGSVSASALEVGDIVAPATYATVSFEGTIIFAGSGIYERYNGKALTEAENRHGEEILIYAVDGRFYLFNYNALRVVSVADGNVYVEPFAYTSTQTYTHKVWTEAIPVGTNAGSYSVTYKIVSNDSNYADSGENTIDDITISMAEVIAPVIASKSYTGEKQTADIAESPFYTVTSNDGGIDVGSYDVVLTLKDPASSKWSDSEEAAKTLTFEITKTSIDKVIAPGVKELTYTGSAQELITTGSAEGGTMQYALGTKDAATEEYTTTIPTATNAGTYYVWYKAVGDDDHIDTIPAAVTVTVGKADLDLSVSLEGWAYGAKANTPEVTGNTGKGTVTYIYKAKDADDKNYSDAVPTAAGTYTVKATVAETDNYNAGTATADFTISKEDGSSDKDESVVTKAPTAKTLTYTGSAQELVTAGTATGGEMQYALGTATEATQPYTTSIPTATNAGTYYVWYRVVGDGFASSAGCVTVVINEEEKLKPGDIVVSEGDLVSEPVQETKYVTAETTVNGEKLSVTISENFVNAIAYTGKKIDAVAHLSMSIDKTPIVSRFKIVDGSSVKPEDLIKVSYVQKYNKRANAAKKSKPTVYARIKVSKDAKKALSREDYKSLKKLVKKLNRELKKNPFNYRINQRSVTACEVKVVAKHGADGKIIVKNGKISGVKKVIVSIDVKDPKTGEITKNTFKLSKKEYSISDPDPENGTVRLTGKRNFTGTVTVKVE